MIGICGRLLSVRVALPWLQGDVDVVYWADFTPATDDTHTLVSGGHDHIKVSHVAI